MRRVANPESVREGREGERKGKGESKEGREGGEVRGGRKGDG